MLTSNLAILDARFPGFSTRISERYAPDSDAEFFRSQSGTPGLRLKGRYLCSRRDPAADAERIIRARFKRAPDLAVFLHFGLGYELEAFRRIYPGIPMLVLEPDVPLFLRTLELRDMAELLQAEEFNLLLDVPPDALGEVLNDRHHDEIEFFPIQSVAALHGEYKEATDEWFRRFNSRREINRNTLKRFGKLWVRNLIRNLPVLAHARPAGELQGLLDGKPALVLAAGPSLDTIIPQIGELRRRMAIIAVDTAANWCEEHGVVPDFLVVVDPQYWNTRHLDGITAAQCLVSESSTHPRVFRKLKGRRYFCSSLFPLGNYLERSLRIYGTLGAGGSVATTAWDFARFLGAGEIYCAGLDLGYPELKTHYRGSLFEELSHLWADRLNPAMGQHFRVLRDGSPLTAESSSGGEVLSDRRLILYRWWFENRLKEPQTPPSFTLSPGGVKIAGMGLKRSQELTELPEIRRELDLCLPGPEEPGTGFTRETSELESSLQEALEKLTTLLEELEQLCREALGLIESDLPFEQRVSSLSDIDQRIMESGAKEIAGFLIDASPEGGTDPLDASRKLYSAIGDSAAYHRRLLAQSRLSADAGNLL